MSLFKISRGKEANLPSTLTNGHAYFTSDEHNFYIDHLDVSGILVRSKINAEYAEKLHYLKDGAFIELTPEEIFDAMDTLQTAVNNKAPLEHDHNTLYYTKSEIDALAIITVADIDAICGSSIIPASEVTF